MAYVERERVLKLIADIMQDCRVEHKHRALNRNIKQLPTADVVEVRHGEWEKDTDKVRDDGEIYDYRCSLCKGEAHEGEYGNNDVLADFCHHCGAKMDGGVSDE